LRVAAQVLKGKHIAPHVRAIVSPATPLIYKKALSEGLIDIFYERAFERLIPQGHTFKVIDTTAYFSYELDTPEDFQRASELLPKELY
jgi:hypothetical protein